MIQLVAIEPNAGARLRLRIADGACGIHDSSRYQDGGTAMTAPLRIRHSAPGTSSRRARWPHGVDSSVESLCRRLQQANGLNTDAAAA